MLNKEKEEVNYWIFQGNPDRYDFVGGIIAGGVDTWAVSGRKYKMKVGDKAIMWITDEEAGCYTMGKTIKAPFESASAILLMYISFKNP